MKIVDCVTYNGEEELFDLRYNILKGVVDEFIVCEAVTTFSGKTKELLFPKIHAHYPDVKYFVIKDQYTNEEIQQAQNSPNTKGAAHWTHEFLQKEKIKEALEHLSEDDIVFVGDCDEIWDPDLFVLRESLEVFPDVIVKLKLRVYSYFLNNRSSEEFWGPIATTYRNIKNRCLNHLRTDIRYRNAFNSGWHFTSMARDLSKKLDDSYTKESYNTDAVQENLARNIEENRDFLGRDFTYEIDESEWPPYLKENKEKYQHLCKSSK